jgi:hypothetical protein
MMPDSIDIHLLPFLSNINHPMPLQTAAKAKPM